MKILALNGSFRKNGNTEILLKQALMGAESEGASVEMIRLTDYKIGPCRGCGLCLFGKMSARCRMMMSVLSFQKSMNVTE